MYPKIIITRNYFPPQWCDKVNTWMKENVEIHPSFGKKGVRKCDVRLLEPGMAPYDGVFSSMMEYVKRNYQVLGVDIDFKIDGGVQHITYNPGDNVGWHDDCLAPMDAMRVPEYKDLSINRKLSMTVMLSDPSDYTGGDFIFDPKMPLPTKVEGKGTVALFTSHAKHKVDPVLTGVRNILFIFVTGPEWR